MSVLTPVRLDQMLPLQQALLDVSDMQTFLGGTGRVLVAKGNLITDAFPSVDGNGFAARVVLMLRNDAPREFLDMTIPLYFNVKLEVKPGPRDDVNALCAYGHMQIYSLLQDTTISPSDSDQLFKTWRQHLSQQVRYDEAVGCSYQTAVYQTILTPKRD